MKQVLSVAIAIIGFLVVGIVAHDIAWDYSRDNATSLVTLFIFGAIGGWGGYAIVQWFTKENIGKTISKTTKNIRDSKKWIESEISEENSFDSYAQAEDEVENRSYDKGLWAKALLEAEGDESKRKITYMRLRAAQLEREAREYPKD